MQSDEGVRRRGNTRPWGLGCRSRRLNPSDCHLNGDGALLEKYPFFLPARTLYLSPNLLLCLFRITPFAIMGGEGK